MTTKNYEHAADVFRALGHPVRVKMIYNLCTSDGCNVNKMVDNLGISQSSVSQHLGILKNCGVVNSVSDGAKRCYRIIDMRVKEIVTLLIDGYDSQNNYKLGERQ